MKKLSNLQYEQIPTRIRRFHLNVQISFGKMPSRSQLATKSNISLWIYLVDAFSNFKSNFNGSLSKTIKLVEIVCLYKKQTRFPFGQCSSRRLDNAIL